MIAANNAGSGDVWEFILGLTWEQLGGAAAIVAILSYLGIDLKTGGRIARRVRGKEEKPQRITIVPPDPPPQERDTAEAKTSHFINVPTGRHFVGREAELGELGEKLQASGEVQVTNSGAILAGQGGIGKTTLARAFAERHRGDYAGVLWVEAVNRQAVIDGLMNLSGALGFEVPEAAQEAHAQAALTKLAETRQDWLIVYDNVEDRADIRGLVPQGAHLIATTRQGEGWDGFAVQSTPVLDYDTEDGAAVALLMAEAGRDDDRAGARALAEALGGLPLALVVAGGMIGKEGLGFGEYREAVERIIAKEPQNSDYPTSVIGAVRMSYDKLPQDARLVADLFAWWAPEGLEERLITDSVEGRWEFNKKDITEDVQLLAQSPERVAAALEALEARSLIRRDPGGFALHRMTAAALRAMQSDRSLGGAAAALLAAVFSDSVKDSANWPACRRLTPHVRALWASGRAPGIAAMDFLANQAAVFLGHIADFEGGAEMARASLALTEARLPEAHRDIAVGHGNLGVALRGLGDIDGAVAALRRAVALDEVHRPGSVRLANKYEMLGGALLDAGRGGDRAALTEALRLYQRAGALWRRLVPRDSDERAASLNKLATVRDVLGQPAAALRLHEYSLAIRRRVLPPGDARLGYGLVGAGAAELKTGAADRAEPLLEEALALWQAAYVEAPRHPEIVTTADWLVSCWLVRAREGENAGLREAKAKRLCEEFGFDFEQHKANAMQYPYTPGED